MSKRLISSTRPSTPDGDVLADLERPQDDKKNSCGEVREQTAPRRADRKTRAGKQILNLGDGEAARFCLPVEGDAVAIIGQNRKLLIFKTDEIPEMTRGRGVILQKYRDVGTADIRLFTLNQEIGRAHV